MRMAKRRIARRVGFKKCLIPWRELILSISTKKCKNFIAGDTNIDLLKIHESSYCFF